MKSLPRIAGLAVVFLFLFAILALRLWSMQVAEGAAAAEYISDQSWIRVQTPAPRGDIRDRRGQLLVTSRFLPAVFVDRARVRPAERAELVQRLSGLLAVPPSEIDAMYEAAGINGRFQVATVDTDLAYQIAEQLRSLPGVSIVRVPERVYLSGDTLAHVVGHLGLPDQGDLEARPELDPNVRIGKLGVEGVYDEYLQGTPGEIAYRVNRRSEVLEETPEQPAVPGATVFLTIDLALQEVVERALEAGIDLANQVKEELRAEGKEVLNDAKRGAIVVLDVKTGAVLAMASYPDFDPQLFVSGIPGDVYAELRDQQAFLNLAVSGLYPPASTFKAVTYTAALADDIPLPDGVEGVDPARGRVNCDGKLELPGFDPGSPQRFLDWYYPRQLGWLDIHGAFEQSCNIFFYNVALGVWRNWKETPRENVIQDQARAIGFGAETGIDLTGEAAGIVPDRAYFEELKEFQLENPDAPARIDASRLDLPSPWLGGDLMNLAIGQGEMTATPLQVALAYASLANGGKVWRPHVVSQIRDVDGNIVFDAEPELIRDARIPPEVTASLLADMNRVVTRGTARRAFEGFGASLRNVGGKTGTGQTTPNKDNHAWFAGVAPLDDPQYAVVVLIEEGGSGGRIAAPVGRHILQYLMGIEPTPIVPGEAAD